MAINVSAARGINIWYNASSGGTAGIASITGADKNNLRFNENMSNFANNCQNLVFNLQSIPNNAWDNVTNMSNAFRACSNLTGSPVCGSHVYDMYYTYYNCPNLSGSMFMKSNWVFDIANMLWNHNANNRVDIWTYADTTTNASLYSNQVGCGSWTLDTTNSRYYNATNNIYVYYNWDGNEYIDLVNKRLRDFAPYSSVTGLQFAAPGYISQNNIALNAAATTAVYGGYNTTNNTAIISMPASRIRYNENLGNFFLSLRKVFSGNFQDMFPPSSMINVKKMYRFGGRSGNVNISGNTVCGPNVINMCEAYYNMQLITGAPACGPNVTDMSATYTFCYNLTGNPVCGPNVTTMHQTYVNCYNLTGAPVCGNSVENMSWTYAYCNNITGSPVCGPNVTDISYAYYNCVKLNGAAIYTSKVTNMAFTYCGAYTNGNLTSFSANRCDSLINACNAFNWQPNIAGNFYWSFNDTTNNSYNLVNGACMFGSHNVNYRINVHCKPNSAVNNFIWSKTTASNSVTEKAITWSTNTSNKCYYNTAQNIYVYYDLT